MSKIRHAFEVLQIRGFRFFWIYFVESVWFDLRNFTSTSSRVPKEQQRLESNEQDKDNGLLYVASFTSVTRDTLKVAKRILGEKRFHNSQFLDLGCGKGKALFIYALDNLGRQRYPAVGIEYDPNLTLIAKSNVEKLKLHKGQVQIVEDSATNLKAYIQSETAVIYFYNSFQGKTLQTVLQLLSDIPHILIYVDPVEKDVLTVFEYNIIETRQGRYNANTWIVAASGLG